MSGQTTEVCKLVAKLRRAGVTVERTRNGHWKVITPHGPVFMASTPSDHRAERNTKAMLRRRGLVI